MNKFIQLWLVSLFLGLAACSDPNRDMYEHRPELTTGEQLYNHHCAECHLESGNGKVLEGIPPVYYHKMTHSEFRKFIRGNGENQNHIKFKTMPKKEARKISQHANNLMKKKLIE